MVKEIVYFFAIFCIVGGAWLTMRLLRRIKQRRNRYRIQQGIAEYCDAAARAKNNRTRPAGGENVSLPL
jgi:hypothetical protein